MLALAERCEAAGGPDRQLDAEIDIAVRGFPEKAYAQANGMRAKGTPDLDRVVWFIKWGASLYTASLDAAMTLVPEGQAIELATGAARLSDARVNWKHPGLGKTPALTLCAAALRAIASTEDSNVE